MGGKMQCQICCCCEQDSQINESKTHPVTLQIAFKPGVSPHGYLLPWATYQKEMEKNASESFAQHYGQESAVAPLPF